MRYLEAWTEASTQGRVKIVDAGVDNTDLDTLAPNTFAVYLVNASHNVGLVEWNFGPGSERIVEDSDVGRRGTGK